MSSWNGVVVGRGGGDPQVIFCDSIGLQWRGYSGLCFCCGSCLPEKCVLSCCSSQSFLIRWCLGRSRTLTTSADLLVFLFILSSGKSSFVEHTNVRSFPFLFLTIEFTIHLVGAFSYVLYTLAHLSSTFASIQVDLHAHVPPSPRSTYPPSAEQVGAVHRRPGHVLP